MTISDKGLSWLKQEEGLILKAEWDVNGWAIGYGCHGPDVVEGLVITPEEADVRLKEKTDSFAKDICNLVKVPLNQNQFDALMVFTFNLGEGNLEKSTLLKLINKGDFAAAALEFPKWDHVNGKPDPKIHARRLREQTVFNTPV